MYLGICPTISLRSCPASFFFKYIHPTLDFIFICVAAVTYVTIFIIYKRSAESVGKELKSSAFILPSLLFLTFILFINVPDLVQLSYQIKNIRMSKPLAIFCLMLYRISPITDAALYIFLLQDVRRFLYNKCKIPINTFRQCRFLCPYHRASSMNDFKDNTENTDLLTKTYNDARLNDNRINRNILQ